MKNLRSLRIGCLLASILSLILWPFQYFGGSEYLRIRADLSMILGIQFLMFYLIIKIYEKLEWITKIFNKVEEMNLKKEVLENA